MGDWAEASEIVNLGEFDLPSSPLRPVNLLTPVISNLWPYHGIAEPLETAFFSLSPVSPLEFERESALEQVQHSHHTCAAPALPDSPDFVAPASIESENEVYNLRSRKARSSEFCIHCGDHLDHQEPERECIVCMRRFVVPAARAERLVKEENEKFERWLQHQYPNSLTVASRKKSQSQQSQQPQQTAAPSPQPSPQLSRVQSPQLSPYFTGKPSLIASSFRGSTSIAQLGHQITAPSHSAAESPKPQRAAIALAPAPVPVPLAQLGTVQRRLEIVGSIDRHAWRTGDWVVLKDGFSCGVIRYFEVSSSVPLTKLRLDYRQVIAVVTTLLCDRKVLAESTQRAHDFAFGDDARWPATQLARKLEIVRVFPKKRSKHFL